MNYERLYVNLLVKHGTEVKPEGGYYERHHILPKSMGGDDSPENLVYLSGRVHFLAHWMLFKIHRNYAMARAFFGMCDYARKPERYFSARGYESARRAFSENTHMRQPEHRLRAKKQAQKQWEENYNLMYERGIGKFRDSSHPMYMKGKVGDAHPRSRAVITPLGRFGSVREAGKAFNISHNIISRYCKSDKHPGFYYEDGGN